MKAKNGFTVKVERSGGPVLFGEFEIVDLKRVRFETGSEAEEVCESSNVRRIMSDADVATSFPATFTQIKMCDFDMSEAPQFVITDSIAYVMNSSGKTVQAMYPFIETVE